jgi:ATP-dependent DNA helicase RecQ
VQERFGAGHVVSVLAGEVNERVERLGHDRLTTFGILKNATKKQLRDWIRQLIGQQLLLQAGDEYPILKLNAASWEVMRSQRPVRLSRLSRAKRKERITAATPSWEGVDPELFSALRRLRQQIAEEIKKPPYVVFNDNTLREMARLRPTTLERMLQITGVGDVKLRAFGERFLKVIRTK